MNSIEMSKILNLLNDCDIHSVYDYNSAKDNRDRFDDLLCSYIRDIYTQLKKRPIIPSLNLLFDCEELNLLNYSPSILNQSFMSSKLPIYQINLDMYTESWSDEPGHNPYGYIYSDNSPIVNAILVLKPILESNMGLVLPKTVSVRFDTTESSPWEHKTHLNNVLQTISVESLESLPKAEKSVFFEVLMPEIQNISLSDLVQIKKDYYDEFDRLYNTLYNFNIRIAKAEDAGQVYLIISDLKDTISKSELLFQKLKKKKSLAAVTFGVSLVTSLVSMHFGYEQIKMLSSLFAAGNLPSFLQCYIDCKYARKENQYWVISFLKNRFKKNLT